MDNRISRIEMWKEEVREDKTLINWLNQIGDSNTNNTRDLYTTAMQKYCGILQMLPSDLIDEVEREKSLPLSKQSVFRYIGVFKKKIKDDNMASTSRATYLASISSFYSCYDVPLPKSLLRHEKRTIRKENDLNIGTIDITYAFSKADNFMKMIISGQFTSGLAMSDIINVTVNDFSRDIEDDVACIKIKRQKTSIDFYTFFSPTTVKLAKQHIDNMKLESNDYLFSEHKGEKLDENRFLYLFRKLSSTIDTSPKADKDYNKFHSHNLRKLFYNLLIKIGGFEIMSLAEYFMGHKIPDVKQAYFKATPEDLRKEYMRFVPFFEKILTGEEYGINKT